MSEAEENSKAAVPSEEKEKEKVEKKFSVKKLILIILVVLVVYCCVFSLAAKAIKSESMPMPLGFGAAVVLSGSMEPVLHINDLIIVTKASDYNVGDVVVYQTGGTPVIHRIIEMDRDAGVLTTQGDANNAPDNPITFSKLKGKLLFSVPLIGFVFRFLKTVPGIIMVLVLLFTLFYLSVRAKEKDEEESAKKIELNKEIEALKAELRSENGEEPDTRTDTEKEIDRLRKQLGLTDQKD